jgi:hypothetical protein
MHDLIEQTGTEQVRVNLLSSNPGGSATFFTTSLVTGIMLNVASKLTVGPGREKREYGAQIFVHVEESVVWFVLCVHVRAGFELKVFGVGSTIASAIVS